jgi:tetratricopeptide (TPR) repeat protein
MQRRRENNLIELRSGPVVLAFAIVFTACAHGPLHEQIAATARQIERDPTNAALYLKLGELHRLHEEFEPALADYARAAKLDPRIDQIDLLRGKTLFAAGLNDRAKEALDRFLAAHPTDADGLATRARVRVVLGTGLEATADLSGAIRNSNPPDPDLYRERAQLLVAEGGDHIAEALHGLDEGIAKLGPIATLEMPAIEIEISSRRFDTALARVDQLAASSPRKETWLARRGEILEKASRPADAQKSYSEALAAIEKLPSYIRETAATAKLETTIRDAVKRIDALNAKFPASGK